MQAIKCPTCSNDMVKARATAHGEDYDYCRVCKKELAEMQPKTPLSLAAIRENDLDGNWIAAIHTALSTAKGMLSPRTVPMPPQRPGSTALLPTPTDYFILNSKSPCYMHGPSTIHCFIASALSIISGKCCACGAAQWLGAQVGVLHCITGALVPFYNISSQLPTHTSPPPVAGPMAPGGVYATECSSTLICGTAPYPVHRWGSVSPIHNTRCNCGQAGWNTGLVAKP